MKIYFLVILFILIVNNSEAQYKVDLNCRAQYTNDSLIINIIIKNLFAPNEKNKYVDESQSIYIPFSEWFITGSKDTNYIEKYFSGWNARLVATILYIPTNFEYYDVHYSGGINTASFFKIKYLPKILELNVNDSVEFRITFLDKSKSLFNDSGSYQLFINIPYINSESSGEILDYNFDSRNYTIQKRFVEINLKRQYYNISERDYENYSKMSIDDCMSRLLMMAVKNNILKCNCTIEKK